MNEEKYRREIGGAKRRNVLLKVWACRTTLEFCPTEKPDTRENPISVREAEMQYDESRRKVGARMGNASLS